jgi:molybdopterin molybdotransferase
MKLMTGAPIPPGADTIVPVEEAQEHTDGYVTLRTAPEPGDHVRRQGEVFAAGATLLAPGRRLSPADLVLAAAAGRDLLAVARPLRAGILVTGSEIVSAARRPGPAQIRNTNGPLLFGALARAGAEPHDLGSAPDDSRALRVAIGRALDSGLELLLTTGGVSEGDFDLVPEVLSELGARTIFHKVSIKPGKPVLFAAAGRTLVFGIPGNPVSAAVVFDLFVRPLLRKAAGLSPALPPPAEATLTASAANKGSRLAFVPARLSRRRETLRAEPLPTRGSHDVLSHARADGYLVLPPRARLAEGDRAGVYAGTEETTLGAFE